METKKDWWEKSFKIVALVDLCKFFSDGHFTLMEFTTEYRAAFWTPQTREQIKETPSGKTPEEAIWGAIADLMIILAGDEPRKQHTLPWFEVKKTIEAICKKPKGENNG